MRVSTARAAPLGCGGGEWAGAKALLLFCFLVCRIFYLLSSFSFHQMTVSATKQKENQVITANRGTENSPGRYK